MVTQLNEPTNQNPIKVPKVAKLTNKKTILFDFGDIGLGEFDWLVPKFAINN